MNKLEPFLRTYSTHWCYLHCSSKDYDMRSQNPFVKCLHMCTTTQMQYMCTTMQCNKTLSAYATSDNLCKQISLQTLHILE